MENISLFKVLGLLFIICSFYLSRKLFIFWMITKRDPEKDEIYDFLIYWGKFSLCFLLISIFFSLDIYMLFSG